jgi:hypothetical protein
MSTLTEPLKIKRCVGIDIVTSNKTFLFAGAALLLATGTSTTALAQASSPESNFSRDRNVSVSARPRADYQASGIHAGGFTIYPKLTTTFEHNDNIYAAKTGKQDDNVWHVNPELVATSNWNRHFLSAYVRGGFNRYSDNSTENSDDYGVGADGRIDVTRNTLINAGASFNRSTEPRTSPNSPAAAKEPTQFDTTGAYLGASQEFNRLKLATRLDFTKLNYDDTPKVGGGVVDQDYRDRNVTTLMARADYAVSPDTALFLEVTGNKRDYRQAKPAVTLNRDSDGVQVLAGANFELGALTRGELGVGYIKQNYDDPAAQDLDGFGARAQVEWFPTQLTTVTLTGARTVEESGDPSIAGYLSNNATLRVDHELLRNVLLSANVSTGKDEYKGIDRDDKNTGAGVSATYLLNRNVGLALNYTYQKRASSGVKAGAEFETNKVGATLTLQF